MTVHGIEPDLYADALRFREVLDGVAGTNRLACRLLEQIGGVESERVFYAPYGVESTPPGPRSPRPGGRLRIGYVGRLEHSQKRVLDLPRVSNALDRLGIEAEWKVAGNGPEEDRLRRAMPAERTSFLGAVPGHDLPARLYREIDALLLLSSWETGPLVVWEAMAEGIPVVVSRYLGSGLEDALQHEGNALLFEIGDTEEAARQLSRLCGDTALAERLAAGGHALLCERYDRERSLDAWEHALAAVLDLPLRRSATVWQRVPPATGRLERWLGPRWAETTRRMLGRRGPDAGSGGEWPHAYGPGLDPDGFFQRARELDRREEGIACSRH